MNSRDSYKYSGACPGDALFASYGVVVSRLLLTCMLSACTPTLSPLTYVEGGIVRGDTTEPALALIFTGDTYADGGTHIREVLAWHNVPATFFFTGHFYRNPAFTDLIENLRSDGHYLGAHSDQHLLYCSWENRDSLLVTREVFLADLDDNYREIERFGIRKKDAQYFMPPYEWYNAQISTWTTEHGLTLVNFTPGTRSNADYTTPDMENRYVSSDTILLSILAYEQQDPHGLNGFLLLLHIGTDPARTDKMYHRLDTLLTALRKRGYHFERIDALLR